MKLKQYLNENIPIDIHIPSKFNIEKVIKILEKDCSKYIKETKNVNKFLIRGSWDADPLKKDIVKKTSRKNRKPRNTHIFVHEYLNNMFEKKFGWKVRNGVFTSFVDFGIYGDPGIFFAKGNYKYAWSNKHRDLFGIIPSKPVTIETKKEMFEWLDKNYKKKFEDAVKTYTDKNFKDVKEEEVSFNTKEYYLVSPFLGYKLAERWGITNLKSIDKTIRLLR